MSLTELDLAREIVVIGFTATFITLGVAVIIIVTLGGKTFVKKVLKSLDEE